MFDGRMKILVWQWGRRGGGPQFGVEVARSLAARADSRVYLSLSQQAEVLRRMDPELRLATYPVNTYRGAPSAIRKLFTLPSLARDVRAMVEEHRPDIAICAMPALLDVAMISVLEELEIPFVAIIHDAILHPGDGYWPQLLLQDRLARAANGLIALSEHVATNLRFRFGADKPIEVIYHAPFTFGRVGSEPAKYPKGRNFRLLFFGRLLRYKGLDLLADAMLLLQNKVNVELAIHGAGTIDRRTRERLSRIRNLSLDVGWVPEDRIPDLILSADALVAPYREASQSGVVPIAYAFGRPVVATPVGGLSEQVIHEETGLLAPAVTASALASTLERLITEEPLYTHCAEAALRHATQRLSWENLASTIFRYCASLVEDGAASRFKHREPSPGPAFGAR